LLAGHFSKNFIIHIRHDHSFFEQLVEHLPDSVIIFTIDGIIKSINKATERVLELSQDKLTNRHISFLSSFVPVDSPFNLSKGQISQSQSFNQLVIFKTKGSHELYLQANLSIFSQLPVLTLRDTTQLVLYEHLISEEQNKSDLILTSILPSNLLPRVKAREKNISFSVQSVSVLFLDIVEFTPWCGSNPASAVMSTLNRLFIELDQKI
jgi:PAS domain S-box-containing protein